MRTGRVLKFDRALRSVCLSTLTLSVSACAAVGCSSRIAKQSHNASAMLMAPATTKGIHNAMLASATLMAIPSSPASCQACAPRRKTSPTLASPTSSVIQASSAPLMNVNPMP